MSEQSIPVVNPEGASSFDADEFLYVHEMMVHAMGRKVSAHKPSDKHLLLEEEDGSVVELRPADIPMNRAAFAVLEHYGDDSVKYQSMMWRFLGLMDIFTDEEKLRDRKRETEHGMEISTAVIMAAASVPLGSDGKFPLDIFLEEVRRIEAEAAAEKQDE